jgi:hypothetical protein
MLLTGQRSAKCESALACRTKALQDEIIARTEQGSWGALRQTPDATSSKTLPVATEVFAHDTN